MARKPWQKNAPFHVVDHKINGTHAGYDIYCKNRPFLRQMGGRRDQLALEGTPRLKRQEAYAIVRLLNGQRQMLKWAERFGDPYE